MKTQILPKELVSILKYITTEAAVDEWGSSPPAPDSIELLVWLKRQVERSRSVSVLLLFGYKVTRTE
jgi:hypothetical protein